MSGDGCNKGLPPGMMPAQESREHARANQGRANQACAWQVISASAPGASHGRDDALNQDALNWWSSEADALAALCVADGHGGSEYTRSRIGALYAVKNMQSLLVYEVLPQIVDGSALEDPLQFKRHLDQWLPNQLVRRWLQSVHWNANYYAHRYADAEEEISAQTDDPVALRYGSTLLAALLTPSLHLYVQLGDGDILTVSEEGQVARPPLPTDRRLFANGTTSLCSSDAWRFVRIHFQPIVEKPPALVMLATDGYANSFVDNAAFEQVAKDLYTAIQQDGPAVVADRLPDWLRETSDNGSGDDISVVIAAEMSRLSNCSDQ